MHVSRALQQFVSYEDAWITHMHHNNKKLINKLLMLSIY